MGHSHFCVFCPPHGNDKMILRDQVHREFVYRRLQFDERSQQVVGADDETFRRCVMP